MTPGTSVHTSEPFDLLRFLLNLLKQNSVRVENQSHAQLQKSLPRSRVILLATPLAQDRRIKLV